MSDRQELRHHIKETLLKFGDIDCYFKKLPFNSKRLDYLRLKSLQCENKNTDILLASLHSLRKEIRRIRSEKKPKLSADVFQEFVKGVKKGKSCLEQLGFDENGNFTSGDIKIDDVWIDLEVGVRDVELKRKNYRPSDFFEKKPDIVTAGDIGLGGGLSIKRIKKPIFDALVKDEEIKNANHSKEVIRDVALKFDDVQTAKRYLLHECGICLESYSLDFVEILVCGCEVCGDCFNEWITDCVTNKDVAYWNCPINDEHPLDQLAKDMLSNQIQGKKELKCIVQKFQDKLNISALMVLPNFRWCAHTCGNGFLIRDDNDLKMKCDSCQKYTCSQCQNVWEKDHDNRTCDQFKEFKRAQNSEIDFDQFGSVLQCPNCKVRFEVARGGCMHFSCLKCRHQFCIGCSNTYFKNQECTFKYLNGSKCDGESGLHGHHPRNCLYFLRDWTVAQLNTWLQKSNVKSLQSKGAKKCEVMVTVEDYKESPCGKTVEKYDLCDMHCREYLVQKINENNLDPIDQMTLEEIKIFFSREKLTIPTKKDKEKDAVYLTRIRQIGKEKVPHLKLK